MLPGLSPGPRLRRVLGFATLLATLAFTPASGQTAPPPSGPALPGEPGEVIIQALRAMEDPGLDPWGDWEKRLRDDPADREAALGLATLAWLQYRYREAEERFEALLTNAPQDDVVTAYGWLSRGDEAQLRGEMSRAREFYKRGMEAARRADSRRAQAWLHIRLGSIRGRLEGLAPLQEELLQAEELLAPDDTFLRALFHCSRAGTDPQRRLSAAEDLEMGASLAMEAGVHRLYAACVQVQASLALNRGETTRALELFHEAQAIQAAVGDRAGRAGSLQRAGHVYVTLGAPGWAQSYLEQAIVEGEASGSLSAVSWALMNLSTISWVLGDLESAREYTRRAEAMLLDQGDVSGLDVVTGQKGDLAFAAGDYPAAREYWTEALARYRERGNTSGILGVHNALLRLAVAEGDMDAAEEALSRARETARAFRMGSWAQGLLFDEGEIALGRGDLPRARRALLAFLEGGQSPFRTYKAKVRLAEVAAREGKLVEAEYDLRSAIEDIEGWRATLDPTGLRRYAFQVAEHAADPDLGVATVISALAEGGRVEEAFDLAERQRARGLFEAMIRADAARGVSLSAPLARDTSSPEAPTPYTAAELQEILPDRGMAVLHFVTGVGGEPTTVFALTAGEIQVARLEPVDSLRSEIRRLEAMVRSGMEPTSTELELGRRLLQPAIALLPAPVQRLAIVPDGALHRVPWDVLRLENGDRVVERYAVSRLPSATVLAELRKDDRSPGPSTLLAFGDPANRSPEENGAAGTNRGGPLEGVRRTLPPLPGAAGEARFVARFADRSQVRTGREATETFLKNAPLESFRVLHFATHALVDEATVQRTALVLAPDPEEDGLVLPGELARLRLQADLVVLSACRTASGFVIRGEGIEGLTASLLEAGARAILATRWEIEDRSGRRFVEDLYRGLGEGETVGEALQAAKVAALRRGEPPAHWAAFNLVGDPDVRVALRVPESRWPVALGVGLVVLLAMGILIRARSPSPLRSAPRRG